jgi:hypothetical protein
MSGRSIVSPASRHLRRHHLAEQPLGEPSFAWRPGELIVGLPRCRANILARTAIPDPASSLEKSPAP